MKKCQNCGVAQENDALFCDACGNHFPAPKPKLSILCLAGFICSTVATLAVAFLVIYFLVLFNRTDSSDLYSLACDSFYVALGGSIAGFILSVVGMVRAGKKKQKGKAFGIVAIAESAVNIIVDVIMACITAVALAFLVGLAHAAPSPLPERPVYETTVIYETIEETRET